MQTLDTPFFIRMQYRFCIAIGRKTIASTLEFRFNFLIVIDLSVEDDAGIAFFIDNGLVSTV